MSMNIPIQIYSVETSRDAVGGEVLILSVVAPLVWCERIELQGSDFFESKKLSYEKMRKYSTHKRAEIVEGNIIEDLNEGESVPRDLYRIISVIEKSLNNVEFLVVKESTNFFSGEIS